MLSDLSPYLHSFREGYSSVYYLSSKGREYVGSKKKRRKNQFVNHVLMRNEFYLFAKCPSDWRNELKIKDGVDTLIVDAFFKSNNKYHFLEIDSTQKMKINKEKIETYKRMFKRGALESHFKHFPPLIWLTTSQLRKKQLKELCKELPHVVYCLEEIK